jgi:hypothetical protein
LSDISLNATDFSIAVLKPQSTLFLENRLQISYNRNTIFSTDDGKLASFTNFPIENLASGMPPKAISAKIVNDGINVEITFDKPVLDVSASKSYFKLKLNDNLVPVTSILTSGSKVILYYSNPVRYGDVAILNFSGSTITSTDGGKQTVIENLSVQNSLPAISYLAVPAKLEAEKSILQSGTQKEGCSDTGGGQNVGYIDTGDWLDFALDVKESGDYTVEYRVSSQSSGGKITLQVLGQTTSNLATTNVNSTGGWQSWTTVNATVKLNVGKQIIRTYFTAGGINLNWLNIIKITTGINDFNHQGFIIYPNPASEILNVEFSENNFNKIELFDMSGKLLLSRNIAHISKIQLPLSYKDGIYCLRIGNDQQIINQKLVVRN